MKIIVTQVRCQDLIPGDLFSLMGKPYWSPNLAQYEEIGAIGLHIYIKTDAPCRASLDKPVYRITIMQENEIIGGQAT